MVSYADCCRFAFGLLCLVVLIMGLLLAADCILVNSVVTCDSWFYVLCLLTC